MLYIYKDTDILTCVRNDAVFSSYIDVTGLTSRTEVTFLKTLVLKSRAEMLIVGSSVH